MASDAKGKYSTTIFSEEAVKVVQEHDTSKPLFLYLAYQAVHAPADCPSSYVDKYAHLIADKKRRVFAGMLSAMDEGIGNVTAALKAKGMLENTLIVFTADNGGPTTTGDGVGSRNWPLRGGKHSIWEGGVRATSFVSGPPLKIKAPYKFEHLMHAVDWFPTLSHVGGYNTSGTLPLDGVSQWEALLTGNSAPHARDMVVLGNSTDDCTWGTAKGRVHCGFGIRSGDWKLLKGYGGAPDTWCNSSASGPICDNHIGAGGDAIAEPISSCPKGFCLYNVRRCVGGLMGGG